MTNFLIMIIIKIPLNKDMENLIKHMTCNLWTDNRYDAFSGVFTHGLARLVFNYYPITKQL